MRRCFACADTPHSGGGIQRASGAVTFSEPLSIQPPRPLAFSLYGGLPMTTVIGSARFTRFASRRDSASGRRIEGMYSASSSGLPSVSVTCSRGRRSAGMPPSPNLARVRSATSASRRSCATAKGPNCSSKPTIRRSAARTAPGTAPAPWSARTVSATRRRTPRRNVPVPAAGSARVTSSEAKPPATPKRAGSRSASSASRAIAATTGGGV